MQIFVKLSSGEKHDLVVDAAETVKALKERLAALANLPEEQQRLVYKGRVLQDNKTLGEYGLEEGHVVHAVRSRHVPRLLALPCGLAKRSAAAAWPNGSRGEPPLARSGTRFVVLPFAASRGVLPGRDATTLAQPLALLVTRRRARSAASSAASPPSSAVPSPAGLGAGLPGFPGAPAMDEAGAWPRRTAGVTRA
jgi:hypothetical protein